MAAVEDEMWYYRALHAHIERELMQGLGEAGGAGSERRVLDAGCGTGGLVRRLEGRHPTWRWTAVDVEPLAIELARARCGATLVQASVTALPFERETFDAVVLADVLYHVDDDAAALREAARVLRPGGLAIVNVPAHRWLWSYHDVTVHGLRRYERRELRAKVGGAGFDVRRATHWNTLPLPLVAMRRKFLPAPRSGSDVRLYPAAVEALLRSGMAIERAWIGAGASFPLGSSLLAVGRKPAR
ncbi:MAG TPA: class I SAM-dependent methyltransferase [Opitutus sp.]|nr:class I SAM-dependent methyltransferase [Opitutus sp.]